MNPVTRFVVIVSCVGVSSFPLPASAQAAGPDQHQRELASSTVATAEMILDAWLADTVPAHYARQTVAAMSKNLADWISQQRSSSSDPNSGTLQAFRHIVVALDRAQQAIRAGDRPATARSLEEIRSAAAPAVQGAAPQP